MARGAPRLIERWPGNRRNVQIEGSVVAVTGASSGIGRATALALAERGAVVVLLARRAAALDELAAECAYAGGEALPIAVDVTDAEAVRAAAQRAADRFGRLDGWVNCAGVTMFGSMLDVPLEDVRRVLDTNVMGYVHGARAALPIMIEQGSGVLVNVSSLLGQIAQPYGGAYSMSKAAIRSLSASLRQELRIEGHGGVKVSTVLPAAIDTPVYRNAANYTGRAIAPPPPVYTPERVAATIVRQLRRPRREVVAGGILARAAAHGHPLLPWATERFIAEETQRLTLRREPAPDAPGNLHRPSPEPPRVPGGWHGRRREQVRLAAAALTAAAGAALAVTLQRR